MGCARGGKYNRINTNRINQAQPTSSQPNDSEPTSTRPNKSRPGSSQPNQSQPASSQSKRQRCSTKWVEGAEEQQTVPSIESSQPKRKRRSKKQVDVPKKKDTLPPVRNDASMTELLRECEAANPHPFMDDQCNDDNQLDGSLNVSDGHSVGENNHMEIDDTSSEEDEPGDEMELKTNNFLAGCDFTVRTSDSQRVSRGLARPHKLVQVSRWFLPEIRFEWNTFWPKWKEVDAKVKERLWDAFKNYFDLSEVVESSARHLFLKQSSKWYRQAIAMTKREALGAVKSEDVKDLIGSNKPKWMLRSSVWKLFVDHWNDPHMIRVSNSAKKSRSTEGADLHRLGNVSLKNRMRKKHDETGKCPSPFIILLEQNRKKNKVTGVDEVHNQKFERAWVKYELLFKTKYGQEVDPMEYPPDWTLWDALEEVRPGREKGRQLGFGSVDQSNIFNTTSQLAYPSGSSSDLTQKQLEDEVEKRKVLEDEVKSLKEKADQ